MALFDLVIILLLAGALLAVGARRAGIPYPALLSLAGAAAAVVPGVPAVTLEPELALALFVAPTLLDAAYDASPRDMRDNWLPIGGLAVVAVALTVATVAGLARILVPEMPWPAAIALGAIVAPPDASAATAVLRQLRPPHRLLVILEGESLWNDAIALLIYRVAIEVAAGGASISWHLAPFVDFTAGGGCALGWVLARLWLLLPIYKAEIPVTVLVQFLGTFVVWIVADRLGVSAIITVVVYAITLARGRPRPSLGIARHRIASYAVWDVAVFVLNVLAFILIGLQLKSVVGRLDDSWIFDSNVAVVICVAVIVVRIVWVMTFNTILRWKIRHFGSGAGRPLMQPTIGGGIVISWCGMRGIVMLATALALPGDFVQRDLIVFCAFGVVMGTLALQGLTLRPLMQRLRLPTDNSVGSEIRIARQATARAARRFLRGHKQSESMTVLWKEYAARAADTANTSSNTETLATLQSAAVTAQRRVLHQLRSEGTIGDHAFHVIEEELDIIELTADPRVRTLAGPE